jgi:4-amino-4-deoxy-L-arabinose transferase-like glycosyltransferase
VNTELRRETRRDALIAVGFVALFLVGLSRPELMDPDEARHAEIARTMLAEHQFLTPRLCGEPYYDKPVGFHWTVAASLSLFGATTAAARLPSALAALWALATTAWWAHRIRDRAAARLSAAMLGTSLLFVGLGRFGSIDMLFAALLTAAIARLSVAADELDPSRRSLLVSYALLALAALVKGPVALLLAMPPFVAAAIASPKRGFGWLTPWRGVAAISVIAAPWYAAAAIADPTYMRVFLETHNIARFAGSETLPHQQSIAYYVVALPLALLPWTPLIAVGALARLRGPRWSAAEVVLAAWIATVLGVFSLAGTRLITYLLPAFPALVVFASVGLVDEWRAGCVSGRHLLRLKRWALVWGITICAVATLATALRVASEDGLPGSALPATVALGAVGAYAVALRRSARSGSPGLALSALASGTLVAAAAAYGPVADFLTASKGFHVLGTKLAQELPAEGLVLSLSRASHALSFYSGHTIERVRDLDAARTSLEVDTPVLLLTKRAYADVLEADSALSVETLWRNARGTALLANARAAEHWRRREGVEPSADHDGRHHGFEDRSGHRTRSLSSSRDRSDGDHP